jgi:hypothetical protein
LKCKTKRESNDTQSCNQAGEAPWSERVQGADDA